jgi:hypothetical protein
MRGAGEACIEINALVHVPGFDLPGVIDWNDYDASRKQA